MEEVIWVLSETFFEHILNDRIIVVYFMWFGERENKPP